MINREDILSKSSSFVKSDKGYFARYKELLIEDFGKLPSGCFGCTFNSHFNKWVLMNRNSINKEIINNQVMERAYKLKDINTRMYFKGEFLSIKSSDTQWLEWLEFNGVTEKAKAKKREIFKVLPEIKKEAEVVELKAIKTRAKRKKK